MIFNTAVLKNMMKAAFRGNGLLVANKNGTIILGGSYWRMQIYEDYFNKKGRAALVELIGQLPLPGESFRCVSDSKQMELIESDLEEIADDINWHNPFYRTKVLLESKKGFVRPYQNEKSNTIYLNEVFTSLLDGKVEIGEDNTIYGPCKYDADGEVINRVFF